MRGLTGMWGPRLLLVAMVALPALSACSDPEKPGVVARPTPDKASSTPSPSPSTPEAQVEATMRGYFETANQMFRTGQVASMRSFSVATCSCRRITDDVEKVVSGGGKYKGTRYDVSALKVHDVAGATAAVEVRASVAAYKVVDGSGKVIEDSPGGQLHTDFSLIRQGERWIVVDAVNLG